MEGGRSSLKLLPPNPTNHVITIGWVSVYPQQRTLVGSDRGVQLFCGTKSLT